MNAQELEMAFGIKAAAKLMILKSKMDSDPSIKMQTADFGGATPVPGAVSECPHCGQLIQEGVMH